MLKFDTVVWIKMLSKNIERIVFESLNISQMCKVQVLRDDIVLLEDLQKN